MKIAQLEGALLDYWVGRAIGHELVSDPAQIGAAAFGKRAPVMFYAESGELFIAGKDLSGKWNPSANWTHGGPIIEREQIALDPRTRSRELVDWQAQIWMPYACMTGNTPLIAAMRAYLASRCGDSVPDLPA